MDHQMMDSVHSNNDQGRRNFPLKSGNPNESLGRKLSNETIICNKISKKAIIIVD